MIMKRLGQAASLLALALLVAAPMATAADMKNCPDGDWCTYHRDANGTRHSPLAQINKRNVANLAVAWIFNPGHIKRGIESTPLAVDGSVYAFTNPSTVWKLNGATGERMWAYVPDMDEAVVSRSFFAHTRGGAVGDGMVFMGLADGRVVALSQRSGDAIWSNQLVDSANDTAGFSGSAAFVNSDLMVIGQNGGEYPIEGKIWGLSPRDGSVKWTFYTTGRNDPEALATWGGDSWKYGGGGSWQPGSVDYANNQIIIGTSNPNPDYDYCGNRCMDVTADAWRPGENRYTSATVALNLDNGKLNWFFMEAPSDPYDYDASPGEYVLFSKDGRNLVLHPGKNGFNHVHDRKSGDPIAVYAAQKTLNWTTGYNMNSGEWENMLWPEPGVRTKVCPAIDGGHSWNAGAFNPDNGLHYRVIQEWCMWLTVSPKGGAATSAGSETRTLEPFVQAFMAATWEGTNPDSGAAHGRLTAREPVSGNISWERRYEVIPHSALLSTGGGLVFNGTFEGYIEALDGATGDVLWQFNNGTSHNGGIISYTSGGKQFILAAVGHGTYVGGAVTALFGDRLVNYGAPTTSMVAYALP